MMKNIFFVICSIVFLVAVSNYLTKEQIIPEEAIRIRVIANSDSLEDQELKKEIKTELENYLYSELKDIRDIDDADIVIKNNLPKIESIVNKYTIDYDINYGMNYFPQKESNGVIYEEGEYESVVIQLGEGKGDNFWCVLFPPLCFLEGEESNSDEVEYTSFIKELINKYF